MNMQYFSDAVLNAVKMAVERAGTIRKLADALDMNGNTISRWLTGDRSPSLLEVSKVMEYVGAQLSLPGEDAPVILRTTPGAVPETVEGDDIITIQVYAGAGAGPGVAVSSLEPLFSVTAPSSHLYRCDFAVMVDGHSMEPTLPHSAVVGAREVHEFKANELYVACIPYEGLVVKRVAVDRERGEFIFKSDNPDKAAYPDFREPIESAEKIIMGRVVWMLRGY